MEAAGRALGDPGEDRARRPRGSGWRRRASSQRARGFERLDDALARRAARRAHRRRIRTSGRATRTATRSSPSSSWARSCARRGARPTARPSSRGSPGGAEPVHAARAARLQARRDPDPPRAVRGERGRRRGAARRADVRGHPRRALVGRQPARRLPTARRAVPHELRRASHPRRAPPAHRARGRHRGARPDALGVHRRPRHARRRGAVTLGLHGARRRRGLERAGRVPARRRAPDVGARNRGARGHRRLADRRVRRLQPRGRVLALLLGGPSVRGALSEPLPRPRGADRAAPTAHTGDRALHRPAGRRGHGTALGRPARRLRGDALAPAARATARRVDRDVHAAVDGARPVRALGPRVPLAAPRGRRRVASVLGG